MIGEIEILGLLVSPLLVTGVLALVLGALVRRGLGAAGGHRLVGHPGLFDAASFVVLWALLTQWFPLLSSLASR